MSAEPRRDSKWWGWGDPAVSPELDAEARGMLQEWVGELEPWPLATEIDGLRDPRRRAAAAGPDRRGRRRSGLHLEGGSRPPRHRVRLRGPRPAAPGEPRGGARRGPAAGRRRRVARAIDVCAAEGIAVVPFGGGTSVVGGIEPVRGAHSRVVSLDLACLRAVEVDRRSLTARLGAGLRGPEAEAALGAEGLTIGHFPQSFQYATIGGFAATRSAGQASSGYGRFDALVSSVRLLTPSGEIHTRRIPAHRRRARPARARDRVRGRLRRHPRRHRQGPPGAEGPPFRGLDRGELRGRRRDRPQDGPGAGPARRDPRLRRGGDPRLARPLGPARPRRQPLRRLSRRSANAAAAA